MIGSPPAFRQWDPVVDDEDGGDDDEPAVATPGDEFASMLVTLYLESKLSAQSVCLLSY